MELLPVQSALVTSKLIAPDNFLFHQSCVHADSLSQRPRFNLGWLLVFHRFLKITHEKAYIGLFMCVHTCTYLWNCTFHDERYESSLIGLCQCWHNLALLSGLPNHVYCLYILHSYIWYVIVHFMMRDMYA